MQLFISDLHLCEEAPDTVAAFLAFLAGPAREAQHLYILGDLFEYWAGDDDLEQPFNARIADALARTCAAGTRIAFISGNRDFLIGEAFVERTGIERLQDTAVIELDGSRALLLHGDTLCTDDVAYQQFRAMVRNPAWQAGFLARPIAERRAIILELRRRSEASKQEKAYEIMDVNAGAVAQAFAEHGCELMIHGHTHRPASHVVSLGEKNVQRHVLADWHGLATGFAWENGQLTARSFPHAS